MTIRAIIFDLGGVLVRTEDRAPRTELGVRFGKSCEEMEQVVFRNRSSMQASLGKITAKEHLLNVMRVLDLPENEVESFYAQFFGGDKVDYALIDYIRSLRPVYKTALLSNAWDDLRQMIVDVWKFDDAFDHMTISAEIGVAKPMAAIYELTLEKLGVAPEESVFVDDFIENIEAARALGMHGIHFKEPEKALATLEQMLNGA
ncbi:MAG: HAD family phosphatase [Chloroflexi bacterium]|nr:HAD family phosphatase [Chloroflexota bacterium]